MGIVFYRLLAGYYPFQSPIAKNMVHMHLFQEAVPLHEIDGSIPICVSNMISKLMEKDVDLRYQSAKGIMHDIELIISEYQCSNLLENELVLAQHDISESFILPQKLYGRTQVNE